MSAVHLALHVAEPWPASPGPDAVRVEVRNEGPDPLDVSVVLAVAVADAEPRRHRVAVAIGPWHSWSSTQFRDLGAGLWQDPAGVDLVAVTAVVVKDGTVLAAQEHSPAAAGGDDSLADGDDSAGGRFQRWRSARRDRKLSRRGAETTEPGGIGTPGAGPGAAPGGLALAEREALALVAQELAAEEAARQEAARLAAQRAEAEREAARLAAERAAQEQARRAAAEQEAAQREAAEQEAAQREAAERAEAAAQAAAADAPAPPPDHQASTARASDWHTPAALDRPADTLPEETPFVPWPGTPRGGRIVLDNLKVTGNKRMVGQALAEAIIAEGPIHVERLAKLVSASFEVRKVSPARVAELAALVTKSTIATEDGTFFWPARLDPATWQGFRSSATEIRPSDQIALEELANALVAVVRTLGPTPVLDLYAITRRVFGGKRVTPAAGARLDAAVELALRQGRLRRAGDCLALAG